jgi:hypothetical protein
MISLDLNFSTVELMDLLGDYFGIKEHVVEGYFEPKDGTIVDEQLAKDIKGEKVYFNSFKESYCLTDLPKIMILHLKRFKVNDFGKTAKTSGGEILIPRDVDFTDFYTPKETASIMAKYKLKSYIVHVGDKADFGHYVTYAEKEGKYFYCNGQIPSMFREIDATEFYKLAEPYIIVLERVSEDEQSTFDTRHPTQLV